MSAVATTDWGSSLVGSTVLHVTTSTVGKVEAFHDGVRSTYESPAGGPVNAPVVVFEDGNAVAVHDPRSLRVLDTKAALFVETMTRVLTQAIGEFATYAESVRIPRDFTTVLIACVFRGVARRLVIDSEPPVSR